MFRKDCRALSCRHTACDVSLSRSVAVLLVLIVKGQTWLLLAYPFSARYRLLLIWAGLPGSPALRVPASLSLPDSPAAFSHLHLPMLGTQKLFPGF